MPDITATTEYGTVTLYGAHGLSDTEIDALYPEGPIRDAARRAVAEAAAFRPGPCADCPECIEKARLAQEAARALAAEADTLTDEITSADESTTADEITSADESTTAEEN